MARKKALINKGFSLTVFTVSDIWTFLLDNDLDSDIIGSLCSLAVVVSIVDQLSPVTMTSDNRI